jgi:hypothetical protein
VIIGKGVSIGPGVVIGGGGPPASTAGQPRTITRPADYNPKQFEPVQYLPKAQKLARMLVPDAELTTFEFDPVLSSGYVDLTRKGRDREYEFRSPARSVLPKGHPRNVPLDRACRISVEVGATEITATVLDDDECDNKLPRAPRCTFVQVRSKARAAGVADDLHARVGWMSDGTWFFDTDFAGNGGGQTSVDDVCR